MSSITSNITSLHNNDNNVSTLVATGGFPVTTIRLNGADTYEVNFESSVILGINNVFVINSGNETADSLIRTFILYYEE